MGREFPTRSVCSIRDVQSAGFGLEAVASLDARLDTAGVLIDALDKLLLELFAVAALARRGHAGFLHAFADRDVEFALPLLEPKSTSTDGDLQTAKLLRGNHVSFLTPTSSGGVI